MRIRHANDNGNLEIIKQHEHISSDNISNRWHSSSVIQSNNINYTENLQYNLKSNYKTYDSVQVFEKDIKNKKEICNKQYRLNSQSNINTRRYDDENSTNLAQNLAVNSPDIFIEDANAYSNSSPSEEEKAFEHSDIDEMSENGVQALPRGIVNPNYPGFQHLAHTLQDYSSNIENFYHSENDMTDDDVDVEITELAYECENNQNVSMECIINCNDYCNNNNNEQIHRSECNPSQKDCTKKSKTLDSHINNEVPDLIKTLSHNNNNQELPSSDFNCSDTDIENNFNTTTDIIGDFNKEIEDEIKLLLNYNINIQDDLEELKKDIKDTFAKPIENTINNISDVVNHVIKKLVETKTDNDDTVKQNTDDYRNINKENEKNTKTEMNRSRPTFLYIESNKINNIVDAHLSDAKDEIQIYESDYDTAKMTADVETTIKQLSTELRKIIPKLDEMRERDKFWNSGNMDTRTVLTDKNSNEVTSTPECRILASNSCGVSKAESSGTNQDGRVLRSTTPRQKIEVRRSSNRQREVVSPRDSEGIADNTISVHTSSARECDLDSFDVYNIETALPKLDIDTIENHIRAAKAAERRKRNDREEIRRRLAMGADNDEYYSMGHTDRPGKKPSLHSRLQNGMNLQICFMNETASDNESQASDIEKNLNSTRSSSRSSIISKSSYNHPYQTRPLSVNITKQDKTNTFLNGPKLRPTTLSMKTKSRSSHSLGHIELKESDFYALQATLQTEARIALAQAKEMARIQMERERRGRACSPVTEMLRRSMNKASAPLAPDRRRVSRQLLTDMNIAQLQVIVNELHSQIESLNESLVTLLMARDELHMGQDSMLVDIEDLTRYLGVKEQTKKTKGTKSGVRRLTSLVHK